MGARVPKILVVGANGQIGSELALALAERYGHAQVITSDLVPAGRHPHLTHEMLNATDRGELAAVVERHGITQIYLLAAALSPPASTAVGLGPQHEEPAQCPGKGAADGRRARILAQLDCRVRADHAARWHPRRP